MWLDRISQQKMSSHVALAFHVEINLITCDNRTFWCNRTCACMHPKSLAPKIGSTLVVVLDLGRLYLYGDL
jgi:hypothetical protein